MIYFTSDTHFSHPRIREYEPSRPEDWGERILADWRARVRQEDTVVFNGDLAMGSSRDRQAARQLLAELPGIKHWVFGNHDGVSLAVVEALGITPHDIFYSPWPGILCGHYPLDSTDPRRQYQVGVLNGEFIRGGYSIYVHGHSHSKRPARYGQCRNVCLEVNDYKLVTLEEIL